MSEIVEWDESLFLDYVPKAIATKFESGEITSTQLESMWEIATSLVDNTASSMIPFDPANGVVIRRVILYSIVCHLTTMGCWDNDASGPLASASQGSVSASFQIPTLPAAGMTAQWYNQTSCGRTAWMLLRPYSLGGRFYAMKTVHPFG